MSDALVPPPDLDWITLDRMRLEVIIGVLPEEQLAEQPLDVAVALGLDLDEAGDRDDLSRTVDYAAVCDEVAFLARTGHWRLLETLAVAMLRHLLATPGPGEQRAPPDRVRVKLAKPTVLEGRAVPGIRLERESAWADSERRDLALGVRASVLVETEQVGAYRVTLQPGAPWRAERSLEVRVLSGEVRTETGSMAAGEEGTWTGEHALEAMGEHPTTLLVVARPPV